MVSTDKVYKSGNTVRLIAEFSDFDNMPVDPDIVKVIFYDRKFNKISEYNPIRIDVGKYILNYHTDRKENVYIYEWYGEIDGNPVLDRAIFRTKFI